MSNAFPYENTWEEENIYQESSSSSEEDVNGSGFDETEESGLLLQDAAPIPPPNELLSIVDPTTVASTAGVISIDPEDEIDPGLRYFAAEPAAKVCRFCRKEGHLFRNCKEKDTKCFLCHAEHDPTRCPLSSICFSCYKRGHQRRDCPERALKKFCFYCNIAGHVTMECEKVWRRYETQIPKEKVKQIFMSCYLCGANDHFGDDCPVSGRAAYRHTAFSEDILTTFADEEEKVGLGNNSNPSPPPPRSPKKDQKTNSPSKSKKTKSPQQQVQLSSPSSRKDQGADNKSGKSNKRRYESEKDDADDKYFRNSYDDYESSFTGGNNGKRRHSDYSGSSYKSNNNSYQYHQSGGSSKSGSKQHQRDSYSPYNSHSKSNNGYGSPSKTGYGQASKSTAPRHKRR